VFNKNKRNGDDSQSKKIMNLMSGCNLFMSEDQLAYLEFEYSGRTEVILINSEKCRSRINELFYKEHESLPDNKNVTAAISVLVFQASKGPRHKVFSRIAKVDNTLYVDLGLERDSYVKITAEGWNICDSVPIKFSRSNSMAPIPSPKESVDIRKLRDFFNLGSEQDFTLLISFIIGAWFYGKQYPILILQGPQGSGKTTISEILKDLIDPGAPSLRALPSKEEDVFIACRSSHLVCFDNLSGINPKIADCLCKISTGCGISGRTLYTNAEEYFIEVSRPIIINGIDDLTSRPDLADRAVVITLPKMKDMNRGLYSKIYSEFQALRPSLTAAILNGLVRALRDRDKLSFRETPRMAEFALTACAGLQEFEYDVDSTMAAFMSNRKEVQHDTVESNLFGRAIKRFMNSRAYFRGTASDLLLEINAELDMENISSWTKQPNVIARELNRLAPALRAEGIDVDHQRTSSKKYIILTKIPVASSLTPSRPKNDGHDGEFGKLELEHES
jgi:hypothetical protein